MTRTLLAALIGLSLAAPASAAPLSPQSAPVAAPQITKANCLRIDGGRDRNCTERRYNQDNRRTSPNRRPLTEREEIALERGHIRPGERLRRNDARRLLNRLTRHSIFN